MLILQPTPAGQGHDDPAAIPEHQPEQDSARTTSTGYSAAFAAWLQDEVKHKKSMWERGPLDD